MKKIFALVICILMVFATTVTALADGGYDEDQLLTAVEGWRENRPTRSRFVEDVVTYLSFSGVDLEMVFPVVHRESGLDLTGDDVQMSWAYQRGLVNGDGRGNLRPNDLIRFSEAMAIMVRVNDALARNGIGDSKLADKLVSDFMADNGGSTVIDGLDAPEWVKEPYVAFCYGFGVVFYPEEKDLFDMPLDTSIRMLCLFPHIGIGEAEWNLMTSK